MSQGSGEHPSNTGAAALFLDRDGVINVDRGYVHSQESFEFIDGIFDLVREARVRGYLVVVVTNQSGIGRGLYSEGQFWALMEWVGERFREHGGAIDAVYFSPFHPEQGIGRYRRDSSCRKPKPGMLLAAARELHLNLAASIFLGDKSSDMEAGAAAGVGRLLMLGDEPAIHGATRIAGLRDAIEHLAPRH